MASFWEELRDFFNQPAGRGVSGLMQAMQYQDYQEQQEEEEKERREAEKEAKISDEEFRNKLLPLFEEDVIKEYGLDDMDLNQLYSFMTMAPQTGLDIFRERKEEVEADVYDPGQFMELVRTFSAGGLPALNIFQDVPEYEAEFVKMKDYTSAQIEELGAPAPEPFQPYTLAPGSRRALGYDEDGNLIYDYNPPNLPAPPNWQWKDGLLLNPQTLEIIETPYYESPSSRLIYNVGEHWNAVESAAVENGVPTAIAAALVMQESGGDALAVSAAGAQGLTQLMPGTAEALGVTDPFNPAQNAQGGMRYLRQQFDKYGDWSLALAAYNAGPGAVDSWIQQYGERWEDISPYAYAETRNYVDSVTTAASESAPGAVPEVAEEEEPDEVPFSDVAQWWGSLTAQEKRDYSTRLGEGSVDPPDSIKRIAYEIEHRLGPEVPAEEGEVSAEDLPGPTRQEELANFLLSTYGETPDWEQVLRDANEALFFGALDEKDINFFKWLSKVTA